MSEDIVPLLGELVDGTLKADELEVLRARLAEDPQALAVYLKWMHLHALLSLDLQHSTGVSFTPPIDGGRANRRVSSRRQFSHGRRWWIGAAVAAIAASILFVVALLPGDQSAQTAATYATHPRPEAAVDPMDEFNRLSADSIAVLANVADAIGPGVADLTVGSPIRPGRFVIESGLVQLEFLSGANVVIEGPAELDLRSTKMIVCHRGKLRVRVPEQAKGFSVDTPHYRAVDLGTEFGVSVEDGDATEVHVFQGEVEVFDFNKAEHDFSNRAPETLRIGNGLRTSGDGREDRTTADSGKFVDIDRMMQILSQEGQKRYLAWQAQSKNWQTDPHVLLYYGMDGHKPSARVLQNSSASKLDGLNGAIVGCRWTEGRWPGKAALEFKGPEDRVRMNIPGEYRSITLSCWIRIDGFDRRLGSIFLTDGHDLGEAHWQFTNNGQLLLGVKADPQQSQEYLSESVLKPTDLGRWMHLACVYDDEKLEVCHYLDGERVFAFPISKQTPLRFGAAELGNWVPEDLKNDRIRNLNGRIDEFLLLDRSMTGDEIRELYLAGRPN
ncbi:MAG: LamG-like jellyroll fold domain-containing protein [Pirellulales bacterium]